MTPFTQSNSRHNEGSDSFSLDHTVSTGSYSAITGVVANASDDSRCWSTASLDTKEQDSFERFAKKFEAKIGPMFFGNIDNISLPSIDTKIEKNQTYSINHHRIDRAYHSPRHIEYKDLGTNNQDLDEMVEVHENNIKQGTKGKPLPDSIHLKDIGDFLKSSNFIESASQDLLEWWNDGKSAEHGIENPKAIDSIRRDFIRWWNNNEEKMEKRNDRETKDLIEITRRDLLTAPILTVDARFQSDGTKICVLNGRVRNGTSRTKSKIDLNGRVDRLRKSKMGLVGNEATTSSKLRDNDLVTHSRRRFYVTASMPFQSSSLVEEGEEVDSVKSHLLMDLSKKQLGEVDSLQISKTEDNHDLVFESVWSATDSISME